MKKRNRYISLFLCLSMLVSVMVYSIPNVSASEKSVVITSDGAAVDSITIEENDKKLLTASVNGVVAPSFQWQILLDAKQSVWVDIYDKKEADCEISYALVLNMLDGADSVYVRCAVTSEGQTVYSNKVCVIVNVEEESTPQVTAFAQTRYVETPVSAASENGAAALNDDVGEYVTITIKYLDIASFGGSEESAIYSPYVATIEKGTDFKQSVVSPTFLGFAPYLDSDGDGNLDDSESAATVSLDYTKLENDVVICVYYKPIKVNFAVKYFFQNINDDLYVEDASRYHTDKAETGTIVTNEYLESSAGDTTGFTKMYHIPESVAADGSTVFECYYDRNYYLVQFDLNGGYGVDPIYARYGTPFIVNDPIRHGYVFTGWKLIAVDTNGNGEWDDTLPGNISDGIVSTIPACNYYYQAQWETVSTNYTVVYWLKDGNGNYNYLGSKIVPEESGKTVSGKNDLASSNIVDADTLKYSVYEKADTGVLVDGDGSTVVNVYYESKEYTLKFYYAIENVTDREYWVIGGTTYHFGGAGGVTSSTDKGNEVALMKHYLDNDGARGQLGQVDQLPELNALGNARNYTKGYDDTYNNNKITYNGDEYRFHYISFTACYGQDISDLWPCSVFDSVTRVSKNTHGKWNGSEAFVSAWNGEYNVWYSRNNANQTIKGNYEKLDYRILFESDPTNYDNVVAYTCFWENGADIGWSIPELYVYNIWIPVLPGEDTSGMTTKNYYGTTYKLIDSYNTCDDSSVYSQTQPSLEGYTENGYDFSTLTDFDRSLYAEGYEMNFYYKQQAYTFAIKNYGEYLVNLPGGVPYATKLSTLSELSVLNEDYTPEYPSTLEENAYYFGGWYTTEQCIPGTEFDLASETMPASGLILYANWVPETHTVRFFTTYDDMLAFEGGTSSEVYYSHYLKHGSVVGTVETPIRSGDGSLELTFAGWFYMENGRKKAYSPLNMPISRDTNIFAEWSSHSPQPYHISYVLQSDPSVKVADDTTGYAYGGSTRTFNAKAGDPYNQLYSEYNNGYFPTVSSHSITIRAEADKDHLQHNIFTFHYVKADNIKYTVRYVNKETNVVMDTVEFTTTSAVVTERFKAYPDMVPDAFYKRLVLEVEKDENGNWVGTDNNVITFYYTPNSTSAYYAVHFMLEKLGATEEQKANYDINGNGGYEETGTHIEGVGEIGKTVYITPQNMSGFTLIDNNKVPVVIMDGKQTSVNKTNDKGYGITVTQNGTELYFFYKRKQYPYQVHYYEYNTTNSLKDSKNSTAFYDAAVTEDAAVINGYTCVSEKTQTITIREDDGTEGLNVIVFYYAPVQYVAEYVAVTGDGGWLSNTIEVISGTESLAGSVPTANQYYVFDGWYLDEACTQSVADYGTVDSVTNRFTPDKLKLSETERNIFYAKFTKNAGDFTINRSGSADNEQVFVYEIRNDDTGGVISVTVVGSSSVTIKNLPLGSYTVTQQNGWSWRYDDDPQKVDHQNADGTTVSFDDAEGEDKWLNGNSQLVKNQRGES